MEGRKIPLRFRADRKWDGLPRNHISHMWSLMTRINFKSQISNLQSETQNLQSLRVPLARVQSIA